MVNLKPPSREIHEFTNCAIGSREWVATRRSTQHGAPDVERDRPYLLERVGEAAVVQLYADGFRDLPLREKTLVWHLAQAAIAGRDIYYDQRYATTSRCATCSRRSSRTRAASTRPRSTRSALHQAVLDQHRTLQQPHRAQVRADLFAGAFATPPQAAARAARRFR
jgi:hypothetical protein